ncbi:TPA: hypothetical protein ACNV3W_003088 [Raoultella ornithinolytica]|uniref:hypothetical protein n=1 Tax=Raoultella TaxID=160674 RepID=UPI0015DCD78D|nr:hypothetical protein [Raoultella ornithinolytica]EJD6653574.1 hypothetical protein [Raoultella ornithinolytica]EKU8633661.1 hypothetical protein [Raoultella ornithinolytica]ELV3660459.1 hypothetical protein [Raoultella ornithinolytica]MCF6686089.1 hypothetical protein [Raoultella ornithinolytica]WPO26184.1 hypothetical protein SH582_09985 [Raoultella ornithinolytica]
MRGPSVLFIVLALSGCVVHSPQMAQYKAEYSNRQDIHSHSLYRFMAKPVKSSEEKYWGAGDLTEFFYVKGDKTSTVELKLDYDSKTMRIKSIDSQNRTLDERTFVLLDGSEEKPSDSNVKSLYLTKDGELIRKVKNCTPDMSAGCQWWEHRLFITQNGDLAVQYQQGGAGMLFLIVPFYTNSSYLEIFPRAPDV